MGVDTGTRERYRSILAPSLVAFGAAGGG